MNKTENKSIAELKQLVIKAALAQNKKVKVVEQSTSCAELKTVKTYEPKQTPAKAVKEQIKEYFRSNQIAPEQIKVNDIPVEPVIDELALSKLMEEDNPFATTGPVFKPLKEIKRTIGSITLTDEQYEGVKKIVNWFHHSNKRIFELAGYAGTGKSTVVDFVLANLNVPDEFIHMCAPTGTASLVLKQKTPKYTSSTLHRSMYTLENTTNGYPKFVPNHEGLLDIKLLVIDEASMIGRKMGQELLEIVEFTGTKILIIGDPEQLPPVTDNGRRAFLDNPDYTLTKIMRQAEDNKIIETSMLIRNNQWKQSNANLKYGEELMTFNRAKIDTAKLYNAFAKCIDNGGAVIVGKNRTRKSLTAAMRNLLGFNSRELMDGERIMVKQNIDLLKSKLQFKGDIDMLTNGMVGIVSEVVDYGYYYTFTFTSEKFDLEVKELLLRKDVLNEKINYMGSGEGSLTHLLKTHEAKTGVKLHAGINATYGYVITCHNSQGSQWDTVYVLDESSVFKEDASRWLYTAVTRAAKKLVIIKSFDRYYKEEDLTNAFVSACTKPVCNTEVVEPVVPAAPTHTMMDEENIIYLTEHDFFDSEDDEDQFINYPIGHCIPEGLVQLLNEQHCSYYFKQGELSSNQYDKAFIRFGFEVYRSNLNQTIYRKNNTYVTSNLVMDLETSYYDKSCYGLEFAVEIK